MNKVKVKSIKFTSHRKLFFVMSISFGIKIGILRFLVGIFNGPISVNIGDKMYTGLAGGALGLIAFPLSIFVFGAILGVLVFWPFKIFMKIKKGLMLYIEIEETSIQQLEWILPLMYMILGLHKIVIVQKTGL